MAESMSQWTASVLTRGLSAVGMKTLAALTKSMSSHCSLTETTK